jgi:alpha-1,2-rhamnosyltransferase
MNRRIYLDCTHTYNSGLNTGIQRVVKNIVKNIIEVSKEIEIEIIPVIYYKNEYKSFDEFPTLTISNSTKKYKIKNILKRVFNFIRNKSSKVKVLNDFLYNPKLILTLNNLYEKIFVTYSFSDKKVEFSKNDILLLIDSTWLNNKYDFYKFLKNNYDIKIVSIIYDLIPINKKEFCSVDLNISLKDWFEKSLNIVDKYICISKFVENECYEYIKQNLDLNVSRDKFSSFYLGANFKNQNIINEQDINNSFKEIFKSNNTYITVSTVEPRKNHEYILNAFEKLWDKNIDVKYLIIGKTGWEVESLINRIKNHKEFNKKLYLMDNIDDEHLFYAYNNSKALIFASFIEGFGLPIIEGLYNKLQVLASDIEIHREIAQEYVSYFDLNDVDSLVNLIEKNCFTKDIADFKWIDWKDSTKQLITKSL